MTPTAHRLRLDLIERGLSLFDQHGYHAVSVRQLADAAGCELDQLYRLFGRKGRSHAARSPHVSCPTPPSAAASAVLDASPDV